MYCTTQQAQIVFGTLALPRGLRVVFIEEESMKERDVPSQFFGSKFFLTHQSQAKLIKI